MDRRSGTLDRATTLRPGDHVCWVYRSDAGHRRVLVSYLSEGLASGERVAYYGARGSTDTVAGYLRDEGHDIDGLTRDGRLILGAAEEAYMPGGSFDAAARLADYRRAVEDALADGYPGFRVAAEAGWLLQGAVPRAEWLSYEVRADLLATEIPFTAMCCYDGRASDDVGLGVVGSVHPLTINVPDEASLFHIHALDGGALAIAGELDVTHTDDVRTVLRSVARDVRSREIDLSGLRFADISGVRAILGLVRAVNEEGGTVRLRGASSAFERLWRLLRIDETTDVVFDR